MKISRRQFLLNSTALIGAWIIPSIPYKYQTGGVISLDARANTTFGAYDPLNDPHLVYVRSHNGIPPKNPDKP